MGHRKTTIISFSFLVVILFSSSYFPDLNKIGGRKCPMYRPYKPIFSFHSGKECHQRSSEVFTNLSTLEEINFRGYNATKYKIQSEDGYISTIIRISGGLKSPARSDNKSVLLFHGLGGSSANWIIQRGDRNFAFILVKSGYEVWLADLRGTSSSMGHTHLDPDSDLSYWNFTIDDIGTRDLPLFLDLIKNETGIEKVYFACHSTGCAVWLAGLAELPELNERFEAGFLLGPASYLGAMYNPMILLYIAMFGTPLDELLSTWMKGRISGEPSYFAKMLGLTPEKVCGSWSFMRCGICDNLFFATFGNDEAQMDYENLPNIISKMQDNIPYGLLRHRMQNGINCTFRKFDYGVEKNLVKYGNKVPPIYNLNGIRVPTYIFYGENDNLVTRLDAEKTRNAIPVQFMRGFYQVEWPLFTHPDFIMARDADIFVYNKILNIMMKSDNEGKCDVVHNITKQKCESPSKP
ncbi:Lipase 3 [Orchesella cincta]|uniref:Lipase 3 n=1 Tax=Orchesella cincta TaxID=48709 RepID=A0A1D2MC07_ORCCI|nr:Lipase 3 [Orchesella cincta]